MTKRLKQENTPEFFPFLNLDPGAVNDPNAPYAVLPLPYERTVTYGRGAGGGPAAILRASNEIEDFDDELRTEFKPRVQTLNVPNFAGMKDQAALALIRESALPVFEANRFLVSLGGEHTVTAPLVESAMSARGSLTVLNLDAHLDLRDEYEGAVLSHACVMKRVRDIGARTVHVGARNCSAAEYEYVRNEGIPVIWARDIHGSSEQGWIGNVLKELTSPVYVSLDIDVLDPSLVPGTGTPEPGGLSWQQVTDLLRAVISEHRVIGADIVEVAPFAGSQASEFIAAKLAAKIMAYDTYVSVR